MKSEEKMDESRYQDLKNRINKLSPEEHDELKSEMDRRNREIDGPLSRRILEGIFTPFLVFGPFGVLIPPAVLIWVIFNIFGGNVSFLETISGAYLFFLMVIIGIPVLLFLALFYKKIQSLFRSEDTSTKENTDSFSFSDFLDLENPFVILMIVVILMVLIAG